ncbi:MAG: hypothetical protein LBC61_02275 [Candidatus Peribacteria bacterium]|nr:hypothetical protein [Candidatus Peribacteria bacterium]
MRITKYACDSAKKLENRFDPFNGDSCSDTQYKNLLLDLKDYYGDVYLSVNNNRTTL